MIDPAAPQIAPIRPKGLLITIVFWGLYALSFHAARVDWTTENLIEKIGATLLIAIFWFVMLWYYRQGKNWTRILLLIISLMMVITPITFFALPSKAPRFIKTVADLNALWGLFMLAWLNRKPVKEFFKKSSNEPSDRKEIWAKSFCICMVTLTVISWIWSIATPFWLSYYGSLQWEKTKLELHCKGEKLTFQELVPPAPRDQDNFFADPIWQQLNDSIPVKHVDKYPTETRTPKEKLLIRQPHTPLSSSEFAEIKRFIPSEASPTLDRYQAVRLLGKKLIETKAPAQRREMAKAIVEIAAPAESLLLRISELLKRPAASFPLHYERNFVTPLPHINELLSLGGSLLYGKSLAELELGESLKARKDVLTLLGLSKTLKEEPLLIPLLVRESLVASAMKPIGHGIDQHQWNDHDLAEIQQSLLSIHLMKDLPGALRGERACFYTCLKRLTTTDPIHTPDESLATSIYTDLKSLAAISRLPLAKKPKDIIWPDQMNYYSRMIQSTLETMENSLEKGWNIKTPFFPGLAAIKSNRYQQALRPLVALAAPALESSVRKTVETQCLVNQAIIACALERYHLAHHSYPENLQNLLPEYLVFLPKQTTTAEPMHYRLLSEDKFLLWAIGWNLQTLHGKLGEFRGEGDILWNQPLPNKERPKPTAPLRRGINSAQPNF